MVKDDRVIQWSLPVGCIYIVQLGIYIRNSQCRLDILCELNKKAEGYCLVLQVYQLRYS